MGNRYFLVFLLLLASLGSHSEEDTPVELQEIYGEIDLSEAVDFRPPDYSGQEDRLGYGTGAFSVPTGMEPRVSFWLDIYTKYSTDQGLLHDSEYVHLVYEQVDFKEIMRRQDLSDRQKSRERRKLVNAAKKEVRERLERLARLKSSVGLSGKDLRYWYLFQNVDEKNKYLKASRKGRLRFQLGQKNRFVEGIYHSGKYIQQMEDIFAKANLPLELTRLVYVESSFNPKARSKVGASGMWQFMRRTAKSYMKLNASVDERNDPLKATESAAKMLASNYKMLESWPLAVTGYNHGAFGVRKLVKRFGTRDLAELTEVRRGRFGFASANFYASFLAALEAEKNALKYFGKVKMAPELKSEKLVLTKNLDVKHLFKWFGGDKKRAKLFNMHVHDRVWKGSYPLNKKTFVRLPVDQFAAASAELKNLPAAKLSGFSGEIHRIQSGETISGIARRYGVKQRTLMDMNNISNPRRIRAGQKLMIP
ncbi:MAG: transglycosylase SLT domain-containing protein [Bdellovibrionales bacterium]|nr:transglycosylase SLT domain-containing protein [Bdellovibrionales bacterium]